MDEFGNLDLSMFEKTQLFSLNRKIKKVKTSLHNMCEEIKKLEV